MASTWRHRIASWIAGTAPRRGARLYAGARPTRTTGGFGGSWYSADAELHASLATLRSRSRQVIRDSAYAKRAKALIVNNVVGSGVGLQAQVMTTRGELSQRVCDDIEQTFDGWCVADSAHTGGVLHFSDLERAALGEVFEAGEALIRLHFRAFGASRVPLALELIEAERLADQYVQPVAAVAAGAELRMGVEVDAFQRPVAYWIRRRHPGDVRGSIDASDAWERVPAAEVFHLKLVTRWPQTRGEPWLHAVVRKLDDLEQYSQHEVSAARAAAAYFATIETPEDTSSLRDEVGDDSKPVMDIEPLTVQELAPGEKLAFHAPNRPNAAFDAFVRAMLREVAAGVGTSYESLSRDYSQSNYSSSRLALLDDRDVYRALQQWWVRSFRQPLHRIWLQQAALAGALQSLPAAVYAVDTPKYEAAIFKCRGWSWVDPTKEVGAYQEAVKAGFMSVGDVIAATANGKDIEDVLRDRRRELDLMESLDLDFSTDPEAYMPAGTAPANDGAPASAGAAGTDGGDAAEADAQPQDAPAPPARVAPIRRTA